MSYVVAAYGVTIGAVGLYLVRLVRERRRLEREVGESRVPAPPRAFPR